MTTKTNTYVVHAITREVIACFGTGSRAIDRAIDYIARRNAIIQAIAARSGYAMNAHEPLLIMGRTGRVLGKGARIDKPTTAKIKVGAGYRAKAQGTAPQETCCILSTEMEKAIAELWLRYPRTMGRYAAGNQ